MVFFVFQSQPFKLRFFMIKISSNVTAPPPNVTLMILHILIFLPQLYLRLAFNISFDILMIKNKNKLYMRDCP